MPAERPRRGRPPLDPSARRERDIRVPVSDAEGAALDAWAEREGKPLATLMRERVLKIAKRPT